MADITPSQVVDLVDGHAEFLVRLPDGTWVSGVRPGRRAAPEGTAVLYDMDTLRKLAKANDIGIPKLVGFATLRELAILLNTN